MNTQSFFCWLALASLVACSSDQKTTAPPADPAEQTAKARVDELVEVARKAIYAAHGEEEEVDAILATLTEQLATDPEVTVDALVAERDRRQGYLRVTLANAGTGLQAHRFANQSSGVLSSVCHSNALAVIPRGATIARGEMVEVIPLDALV